MTARQRTFLVLAIVGVLGVVAGWKLFRHPSVIVAPSAPSVSSAAGRRCDRRVTKEELERSISLGTHFMTVHQKPAGNFDYEYDWKERRNSKDDNAARQSGALWGLSLLYEFGGTHPSVPRSPELKAAVERGIAYWDASSVVTKDGWRYPVYRGDGSTPTESTGGVGMASLVTLAIIEYVRSLPASDASERARFTARANEYIGFVAGLLRPEGTWPGDYRYDTGAGTGDHSPYSDGEALLCLVTAMKYLDRADLQPLIQRAAIAGHRANVDEALAKNADSDTTKGYYQWSSMAFYELATSSMGTLPGAPPYGDWLLSLGDWIIDVHHILTRERNTGYAYEGLVSSLAWAKATKDPRAEKYSCAIHQGLSNLMGWQIGHPRAASLGGANDVKAVGGVQNHAVEAPLRIDVVQHQMHATMLADDHLFE